MSTPKTIRWGIMATGGIAATFVKDLFIDPKLRSTNDIVHEVTAVASSSSKSSAESFISKYVKTPSCAAYGSYAELVKDKNVDLLYIASPHSHHFQNCMLALTHDKPVLCEKAFTVNAEQARLLYKTAKERKLFLMEAVWTRYFPLSIEIRQAITSGKLGDVLRVVADNSFGGSPEEKFGKDHRMVNMDLAGGALLDLGIYSLTWVFQSLYHTLPAEKRAFPKIAAQMTHYPGTGADEHTTILLQFPHAPPTGTHPSHAMASTGLRTSTDPDRRNTTRPAIRIMGTKGEIAVDGPAFRPMSYRFIPYKDSGEPGSTPPVEEREFSFPGNGHGMYYEADEAARCWRDGKLESEGLTWEESTVIMEVMDEVRKQGGLKHPESIETTKYPVELPGMKR